MSRLKRIYHRLEHLIDFLILPAIFILFIVIVIELFFHDFADTYHTAIIITDYCIIGLFVLDLMFKFNRARSIKSFLRESWLDIIAVFPIFIFLRAIEPLIYLTDFSKEAKNIQLIFHESLEITKSTNKIVKEAEALGKVSRARYITAAVRAIGRSPRFLKGVAFYERPGKKLGKTEYKKVKKLEKKAEKKLDKILIIKNWFKRK